MTIADQLREEGVLMGQIQYFQKLLRRPVSSNAELGEKEESELKLLLSELEKDLAL